MLVNSILKSQWLIPQSYMKHEIESRSIWNRLIAEVENMTEIPMNAFYLDGLSAEEKTLESDYWKLMESGRPDFTENLLVPFDGWSDRLQQLENQIKTGRSEISIWTR